MPRPPALARITTPLPTQPIKLSPEYVAEFARLLGVGDLADIADETLAWLITYYDVANKISAGHTAQRMQGELLRIAKRLQNGERGEEILKSVIDPWFGQDYETHVRLAPMLADTRVPTPYLSQGVEARRKELAALRPVKPKRAVQALIAAYALLMWLVYAARRHERARQWQFVLAVLDACGASVGDERITEGLRRNPKRLLRDLGRLPELTRGS